MITTVGCFNSNVEVSVEHDIKTVISNHDYTMIYVGTEWCKACHYTFTHQLAPYRKELHDSTGFVVIIYGSAPYVEKLINETNYKGEICTFSSMGGLDKLKANKLLASVLKGYKGVNYMPIIVLCDQQGRVLNFTTNQNDYLPIDDCIRIIKKQ